MNEQRLQGYLNLIQRLLNCRSYDEVREILAVTQELVYADFLQMVADAAEMFSQLGDENTANWLRGLAMQLGEALNLDTKVNLQSLSEEKIQVYYQFLEEVLQAIAGSRGDALVVYPLLENNTDKLDEVLVEILRRLRRNGLREAQASQAPHFLTFSDLIQQFPLGNKASNMEIAITGYEIVLTVYTRETFPEQWADTQKNLVPAYVKRILGEKAENIEQAIAACNAALSVYTHQHFPEQWAKTQLNLGVAYRNRIRGNKAENIEQAIAACNAALSVYTRQHFPEQWAKTQLNLGVAYFDRIIGDKAENIEQAIAAYSSALSVFTRETSPFGWANAQNNRGNAYGVRILGDKAENIEQAIAALSAALLVFTPQNFPQEWANTQANFGPAYLERILGEKAENIEQAIAALSAALLVYTRKDFPQEWARAQVNLGNAYVVRILGDKAENIEQAINACNAALSVYTPQDFPELWAKTQTNLGGVYRGRIQGNMAENIAQAINACNAALSVYTLQDFPQEWARTQTHLGCYLKALEVYTSDAFPEHYAKCSWYLGMTYQKANQLTSAYNTFESAIATVESLREEIVSGEESKRKQAEEWNKLYGSMVEVCLELNKLTDAIEYVERSKTRNLVEQILGRDLQTIFPPAVVTQLETYRDEIARGQYQIQNRLAENPRILAQNLQQLRQQRNELQNRYLPVGYGFKLDTFQRTLEERTAMIEWYILENKILAFIFTQRGNVTVWQSQPEDREDLESWETQYLRNYYERKDQWQNSLGEELSNLASILHIDEILTYIPNHCDKLILIPHWFLHLFPLHALPVSQNFEDSRCLLDLFPRGVGYAPSCQILQQVQMRQRPDFQSLFAIQNPTEDLSFTDLEVESILSYFPGHQVLSKKQATKAALSQAATQLQEANYLHFSCHGSFNLNSPQNSCLVLADAYVSPDLVDADSERSVKVSKEQAVDLSKCLILGNLFERNFDFSQSRLVVLSACETGLIDRKNTSDEYIGLPSGFLYAGSSSVVSSLWTVDDLSTSFLMIKFIQILKSATDMSVPLAMNQAQRWLRDATKEELQEWTSQLPLDSTKKVYIRRQIKTMTGEKPFNSPFHWAAFVAIGA